MKVRIACFVLLALFASLSVSAGAETLYDRMPEKKVTERGVEYVSGGVGVHEREAMARMSRHFSLKIVLSSKEDGSFLAGCTVKIYTDGNKNILFTRTAGPWLLVDLPPGGYRIKVREGRHWKTRRVNVSEKCSEKLYFILENDEVTE